MTESERQELRDFLARKAMGWIWSEEHKIWVLDSERDADGRLTNCTPDELYHHHDKKGKYIQDVYAPDSEHSPASQLLGVIEGMREKGFVFACDNEQRWIVRFWIPQGNRQGSAVADTFPDAVCLAARAALEGK